jgi:hypothetical protein
MDHHDDFHYAEDYPLRPLEDDCQLLGDLLDDCLKIEIGAELFQKVNSEMHDGNRWLSVPSSKFWQGGKALPANGCHVGMPAA